jgi:hypothetical protein
MPEKSGPSELSQVRLLESGKAARRLLDRLGRARLSPREMADTIALVGRETSVVRSWIHAIDEIATHGAREFARTNSTAASDAGLNQFGLSQVTVENGFDPWQVPAVRMKFSSECRIQFHLRMMSMDNLSQLGSLALDSTQDSERWEAVSEQVWTAWGKRGAIGVVRGGIKSGKTNICLLISQYFMQKGYTVVSNIVVFDPPPTYIYSAKLSDMLIAICEARLKDKEVLLVLDEAALYWNKIQTVMKKNIDLSKLLLCIGKLHCCLLFCSHFEEGLPGIIARNSVCSFEKRSLQSAFVEVDAGIKIRPRLLVNIPGTTLLYDADQLQYWSLDMSTDSLFDFMSSLPQGANQWQLVLEYVRKHQGEASEDAVSSKQVAMFLRQKGLSEKKIAEAIQKAPSTVHEWVKVEK